MTGDLVVKYDVIIVGAGPAGSMLALQLGLVGRHVLLIDGARFPREKVCGEGMMPQGVQILRSRELVSKNLEQGFRFYGIRYTVPGGSKASAYFPSSETLPNYGVAMRRVSLDQGLIDECRKIPGIELRLGVYVKDIRWSKKGLPRVSGLGLEATAEFIVGADGSRSMIRKWAKLDAPIPRKTRWAVRGHFNHAPRSIQRPQVEVLMIQHRELYLTPLSPTSTGVVMTLGNDQLKLVQGRVRDALLETLNSSGDGFCRELSQSELISRAQAIGPLGIPAKSSFGRRVLLVGDAAGALDPITGEGLSISLKSSVLAAQAIFGALEKSDFSLKPLRAYHKTRLRTIRELSMLTSLVLWLSQHPSLAHRIIGNLGLQPATFTKLLGIAAGSHGLRSLSPRDAFRIVLGK